MINILQIIEKIQHEVHDKTLQAVTLNLKKIYIGSYTINHIISSRVFFGFNSPYQNLTSDFTGKFEKITSKLLGHVLEYQAVLYFLENYYLKNYFDAMPPTEYKVSINIDPNFLSIIFKIYDNTSITNNSN